MTASDWHFVVGSLDAAMASWRAERGSSSRFEEDALLDLIIEVESSPMTRGAPDLVHAGFWEARSPNTNILVTYLLESERFEIFVVAITRATF